MKFEYSVLEAADIDEAYALEAECFSRPWKRKDFEDAVENSVLYLFMKARGDDGSYAAQAGLIISYDTADITNVAVASGFRCTQRRMLITGSKVVPTVLLKFWRVSITTACCALRFLPKKFNREVFK